MTNDRNANSQADWAESYLNWNDQGRKSTLPSKILSLEQSQQKLEAAITEQEHRLPRVIFNWFIHRSAPKDDPVRRASFYALVWRLLPTQVLGSSVGILAIAGLVVAVWANGILQQQNGFIQQQIEQQSLQDFHARKSELIAILYDRIPCAPTGYGRHVCPHAHPEEVRAQAFHSIVALHHIRAQKKRSTSSIVQTEEDIGGNLDLAGVDISGLRVHDAVIEHVDLRNANLSGTLIDNTIFRDVNFLDSDLSGVRVARALFERCNFWSTNLEKAEFASNTFVGGFSLVDPAIANDYEAALIARSVEDRRIFGVLDNLFHSRGAVFLDTTLAGVNARGATFTHSRFGTRSTLMRVDFTGAKLIQVDYAEGVSPPSYNSDLNLTHAIVHVGDSPWWKAYGFVRCPTAGKDPNLAILSPADVGCPGGTAK